jgi:hypothetical protein
VDRKGRVARSVPFCFGGTAIVRPLFQWPATASHRLVGRPFWPLTKSGEDRRPIRSAPRRLPGFCFSIRGSAKSVAASAS